MSRGLYFKGIQSLFPCMRGAHGAGNMLARSRAHAIRVTTTLVPATLALVRSIESPLLVHVPPTELTKLVLETFITLALVATC